MILTLVLSFAAIVPRPTTFVFDARSWSGTVATEVNGFAEDHTGHVLQLNLELSEGADPDVFEHCVRVLTKGTGWKTEHLGQGQFTLSAPDKRSVRRVFWNSSGWTPTVRMEFAPPAKP